jgi:hypothetical protein
VNKKLKARWVKALESGRYKQAEQYLKTDRGFCCLGVLRQIMHPGSKKSHVNREGEKVDFLCKEHAAEAGLSRAVENKLAEMNDSGKDFIEIAKHIKRYL